MTLLIGALTIGLILSLLALGRVHQLPRLQLSRHHRRRLDHAGRVRSPRCCWCSGTPPLLATSAGFRGGMVAGAATGVLHTKFKINGLLAGILVMTALYSVNLHVMGKSNVPLLSAADAGDRCRASGRSRASAARALDVFGWDVSPPAMPLVLLLALAIIVAAAAVLYAFFRTNLGHGDARHRRQRPDDPRARRQRRQHDRSSAWRSRTA